MMVIADMNSYTPHRKAVVTVGNFDGIHRGHELLFERVIAEARARDALSMVVTFEPHTRSVLNPDAPLALLSTFEEKERLLSQSGVDVLVRLPFTESLRNLTAVEFVRDVLEQRLGACCWVMGSDHEFGKDRSGSKKSLHEWAVRNDITIFPVDLRAHGHRTISSTQVRQEIVQGNLGEAVSMLGHPYLIGARRIAGEKVGTRLGFPTLNFACSSPCKVLPPAGVYAARLECEQRRIVGALYFGDCPTFGNRDIHFEFHMLEPCECEPALGERSWLWVSHFIRRDQRFETHGELIEAIQKDIENIQHYFSQE